jgi:hypothetical protein
MIAQHDTDSLLWQPVVMEPVAGSRTTSRPASGVSSTSSGGEMNGQEHRPRISLRPDGGRPIARASLIARRASCWRGVHRCLRQAVPDPHRER